jgi:hypothetical protein
MGGDLIPMSNAVPKVKPRFDRAANLMEGEGKLTPSASVGFGTHSPRAKARWHER